MIARIAPLLVAALFVLPATAVFAQPPALPPAPVPVQPAQPLQPPAPPPGLPPLPPAGPNDNWLQTPTPLPPAVGPLPVVPPAPSTGLATPGPNGWGPYGPPSPAPAFFLGVDVDVSKPVFKNKLTGTVGFPDGSTDTLHVTQAPLEWTGSPRFELGYVLPDSLGEFVLGYRYYASEGNGIVSSDLGEFGVHSRLEMNVIDFDYNSARYSPLPRLDMKWTIGARIATVDYDTSVYNNFLAEGASNNFYGAGPHAAGEIEKTLGIFPSLGFFVKGDAAVLIGQIKQDFDEAYVDSNGNIVNGGLEQRKTQSVPVLNVQAGINYNPSNMPYLHFSLGYEFEHWFSVGRVNESVGELTTQGVFLRAQFDF